MIYAANPSFLAAKDFSRLVRASAALRGRPTPEPQGSGRQSRHRNAGPPGPARSRWRANCRSAAAPPRQSPLRSATYRGSCTRDGCRRRGSERRSCRAGQPACGRGDLRRGPWLFFFSQSMRASTPPPCRLSSMKLTMKPSLSGRSMTPRRMPTLSKRRATRSPRSTEMSVLITARLVATLRALNGKDCASHCRPTRSRNTRQPGTSPIKLASLRSADGAVGSGIASPSPFHRASLKSEHERSFSAPATAAGTLDQGRTPETERRRQLTSARRRWASRYAKLQNPACSHPRRRRLERGQTKARYAKPTGAHTATPHKNRMTTFYQRKVTEVLPRPEALVNRVLRIGATRPAKCIDRKENPGPSESDRDENSRVVGPRSPA